MKLTILDLLQRIREEQLRRELKQIKAEDKEIQAICRALAKAGVQ